MNFTASLPAGQDRCVLKTSGGSYVKLFFGPDAIGAYMREHFVGRYMLSGLPGIVTTTGGGLSLSAEDLAAAQAAAPQCKGWKTKHNPGPSPPYVITAELGGKDLADWLETDVKAELDPAVVRSVAFQLVWLVAQLHQQGVQHNDITEQNIRVEIVARGTLPFQREYKLGADRFAITFLPGDVVVSLFDFGAADVRPAASYPTPHATDLARKVWRYFSNVCLQENNAPEYYWSETHEKNLEADSFMLGYVIMSLACHGRGGWFFKRYRSAHLINFDAAATTDDLFVAAYPLGIDWERLKDELSFINTRPAKEEDHYATQELYVRLWHLAAELGDANLPMSSQMAAFYATTAFRQRANPLRGMKEKLETAGCYAFLQRIMRFNPAARRAAGVAGENYGLTSALYDEYFAEYYRGQEAAIVAYSEIALRQPLPYNDWGELNNILATIATKETTFFQKEGDPFALPDSSIQFHVQYHVITGDGRALSDEFFGPHTVEEFKKYLQSQNLPTNGNRADLIARIRESAKPPAPAPAPTPTPTQDAFSSADDCLQLIARMQAKTTITLTPSDVADFEVVKWAGLIPNVQRCINYIWNQASPAVYDRLVEARVVWKDAATQAYAPKTADLYSGSSNNTPQSMFPIVYIAKVGKSVNVLNIRNLALNGGILALALRVLTDDTLQNVTAQVEALEASLMVNSDYGDIGPIVRASKVHLNYLRGITVTPFSDAPFFDGITLSLGNMIPLLADRAKKDKYKRNREGTKWGWTDVQNLDGFSPHIHALAQKFITLERGTRAAVAAGLVEPIFVESPQHGMLMRTGFVFPAYRNAANVLQPALPLQVEWTLGFGDDAISALLKDNGLAIPRSRQSGKASVGDFFGTLKRIYAAAAKMAAIRRRQELDDDRVNEILAPSATVADLIVQLKKGMALVEAFKNA